ncbi:MAG: hypothetical protein GC134_05785 [Proteobacteria bacterium]|nr:hypothetical protein [Pseudomonadota bacterium]
MIRQKGLMLVATALLMSVSLASVGYAQDKTVRTGAGGVSSEAASIDNIRNLYDQVINTVVGVLSVTNNRIVTNEEKLEDLRREINNIETVHYTTQTVYVDNVINEPNGGGGGDGGGDDGGGCG